MIRARDTFRDTTMRPWQPQQPQQIPMANLSHQQQEDPNEWAMSGIAYPGKHDVMLGRGGESNYHAGNLTFRSFIQEHKIRYQKARKQEKPIIALEVVLAWRDLSPPGRFLARVDPSRADSLWEDVGDDQACKRAGRTLGEKCSAKATSTKQPQHEQEAECNKNKQTADYAVSDTNLASLIESPGASSKTVIARRPSRRRPQSSMDFIRSRETIQSPPASTKRRRLASRRDLLAATTANLVQEAAASLVTPQSPKNKVLTMEQPKAFSIPDLGSTVLGQGPKTRDMRETLPTAEFLTHIVRWD